MPGVRRGRRRGTGKLINKGLPKDREAGRMGRRRGRLLCRLRARGVFGPHLQPLSQR